jgi:hypothetical protein
MGCYARDEKNGFVPSQAQALETVEKRARN